MVVRWWVVQWWVVHWWWYIRGGGDGGLNVDDVRGIDQHSPPDQPDLLHMRLTLCMLGVKGLNLMQC